MGEQVRESLAASAIRYGSSVCAYQCNTAEEPGSGIIVETIPHVDILDREIVGSGSFD